VWWVQIGIVGLPNVGKSTTFNLLTKLSIPAENFPFCTIEPNHVRLQPTVVKLENLQGGSVSRLRSLEALAQSLWMLCTTQAKASRLPNQNVGEWVLRLPLILVPVSTRR
jgi:hypothetical protein